MGNLQSRQKSKVLVGLYVFCFAVASIGGTKFVPSSAKVATLLCVAVAFTVFLVTADFTNIRNITGFVVVYSIWILVIMVYSMIIWIMNFESVQYIVRGCSKVSFQFIVILNLAAAAYLFGEKGIHYTFYGLALGNLIIMILYIPQYGISEVVSSFMYFLLNGWDAIGYMKMLEIHDVTFTYGFFLIYFIFFDKTTTKKMKIFNIVIAAFFFFIGMKRIAAVSLILMLGVAFFLGRMTPRIQTVFMKTVLVCGIIFAFCYLIILKFDIFMKIMDEFGVDVMGRNVLYDSIDKYYTISPSFVGYGFEYVHIMMLEIAQSGNRAFNNMVDIHNDFMRVYIEMGFWGFLAWCWYTLIFQFNWIKSKFNVDTARLFFLCEFYIFFTYMTDNTLFYFFTGMVLRMIPLCYALNSSVNDGNKKKLVLVNDVKRKKFEIRLKRGDENLTLYQKRRKNRNDFSIT